MICIYIFIPIAVVTFFDVIRWSSFIKCFVFLSFDIFMCASLILITPPQCWFLKNRLNLFQLERFEAFLRYWYVSFGSGTISIATAMCFNLIISLSFSLLLIASPLFAYRLQGFLSINSFQLVLALRSFEFFGWILRKLLWTFSDCSVSSWIF